MTRLWLKEDPYNVKFTPSEFAEVMETMQEELSNIESDPDHDQHTARVYNVLTALELADKAHQCADDEVMAKI